MASIVTITALPSPEHSLQIQHIPFTLSPFSSPSRSPQIRVQQMQQQNENDYDDTNINAKRRTRALSEEERLLDLLVVDHSKFECICNTFLVVDSNHQSNC